MSTRFSVALLRPRTVPTFALAALLLISTLAIGACSPSDPVAGVDAARAEYTVELTSFFMRSEEADEIVEDAAEEIEEAYEEASEERSEGDLEDAAEAMEDAAEAEAEMNEEIAEAMVDEEQDAILDVIVLFKGRDALPGLTVEVTQARDGAEIETWYHYLETGPMVSGGTRQMSIELEEVDYQEGDGFSVSVPTATAEQREEFREYDEAD